MKDNKIITVITILAAIVAVLCAIVVLTGCAKNETPSNTEMLETVAGTTEETTIPPATEEAVDNFVQNSVFKPWFDLCGEELADDVLMMVYNEPFDFGEPTATETIMDGEFDRAYLFPRYSNCIITLYQFDDVDVNGVLINKEVVKQVQSYDTSIIFGAIDRPEGMAKYCVEIVTPDGRSGSLIFTYNGNEGTPTFEIITADAE